jgi:hypothetical protein
MNARTCSTCSNFNENPAGLHPTCWADVLLPAGTSQREPGPTDYCELHSTHDEAAGYIAAAYATDPELQELVKRQFSGENELKHVQNQAASEAITASVLGNLRKGGAQ